MKIVKEKLNSTRGYTLMELMMVMLILALLGSVVGAGLPAAINNYKKVVDSANAQVLLSTTVTCLRRELALATAVKEDGSNEVIQYTNGETGREVEISQDDEKGIKLSWKRLKNDSKPNEGGPLVTSQAATPNLVASYESITYADGVFSVSGLQVKNTKTNTVLAELGESLKIRAIVGMKATA